MNKPLADRIRPTELSEVVGQRHLLSPGKPLYNMIENGEVPNLIFYGPSGVGKSSITNFIQPEAQMETGGISEKIRRGKHTTRHSELFFVEEGTYMMDTPGFSSLYIEDLEPEALKDFFPEFEAYEDECRFLGCVHIGERECGVKTAVQEHKIGQSRYDNYRLMYQELKEKKKYGRSSR